MKVSPYLYWISWLLASICISILLVGSLSGLFVTEKENHAAVMHFFTFSDTLHNVTSSELIHMQEVRLLFFIAFLLALVLIIFNIYFRKYILDLFSAKHFFFPLSVLGVLALLSAIFFEKSFILFHKLLFRNDFWIFPADSWIIQTYPFTFFAKMGLLWFVFTVLLYAGIFLWHKRFKV